MTLLIKLLTASFFIGMLIVGGALLPPFPPEFKEGMIEFFSAVFILDHWFPVRLAIQLFAMVAFVEAVVYAFKLIKWFKAFLFGDSLT